MVSVQAQNIGAPPWKDTVQCVNRDIPAGYSINKKEDFGTKEIDAGPVEWAKKPRFRDDCFSRATFAWRRKPSGSNIKVCGSA